jgi:hypothetical protein
MSRGEKFIAPYYVDSVTRSFQAIARVLFEIPQKIVDALDMLTNMNVEAPKPLALCPSSAKCPQPICWRASD